MQLRSGLIALGMLLLLGPGAPALAQGTQPKCEAAQLKASGRYALAGALCEAIAAKTGSPVDPECEGKAAAKLAARLEKAETQAGGDCLALDQDELVQALADAFLDDLAVVLEPPATFCCAFGSGNCAFVATEALCTNPGGSVGAAGSVCNPSGDCEPPPAQRGPCCEGISLPGGVTTCGAGSFDAFGCASEGVSFFPDAICHPSGRCLP